MRRTLLLLLLGSAGTATAQNTAPKLSSREVAAGWRLLFDGQTTHGWRGFKRDSVPSGWSVVDATLTKSAATGDIMTRDQFANFELELDWQISKGGNSGIFFRGTEEENRIYWTAPEYQLLDDENTFDGRNRLTSAGSAYGLYAPPEGILKPPGEWNTTRILVKDSHVEHWLNGKKLLEYELGSEDWEAKVKASKFAVWPKYGRAKRGHIAIQGDHEGRLSIRKVKIREIL
ncbi:MAG: DUF1080 domain-containing protein [Gemmatimonadales bacterium]|nr:DUF1080 domain-containing protein [Gemmatimonadales bacterium]